MIAIEDNTTRQTREEWLGSPQFLDAVSLALHRAVAVRLREDAEAVLSIARNNLRRWLNRIADDSAAQRPWREWRKILDRCSPDEICELITQDTDEGQRLRSSTPFAGVLTPAERASIWQTHEQTRFIQSGAPR